MRNKYEYASLKSIKKGVGSISQRYGSGNPDPDPHQNVTDPQHWKKEREIILYFLKGENCRR
jgi:hypothetical protein